MQFLHINVCSYFGLQFVCFLIISICVLAVQSICFLHVHLHFLLSVFRLQYLFFHLSKQYRPPGNLLLPQLIESQMSNLAQSV